MPGRAKGFESLISILDQQAGLIVVVSLRHLRKRVGGEILLPFAFL
jgi:hypothetical protein